MPRILVTGAAGALGAGVIAALAGQGGRIVGLDRGPCPAPLAPRVAGWIAADLRAGAPDCAGFDAVLHLAAIAGRAAEADPAATMALNAGAGARLLAAAEAAGARFVLASSVAAIGAAGGGTAGDDASLRPVSAYGRSKAAAEATVRGAAARGAPACALRLPTLLIRAAPRSGPPTTGFLSDIANALLIHGAASSPMPADFPVAVAAQAEAAQALARLATVPWPAALPPVANLPAFALTPAALAAAVSRHRPDARLACAADPDPAILAAAGGWPVALASACGAWLLAGADPDPAARLDALVATRARSLAADPTG